ncbi:uroporphyrinogen decarboxylase family protein [Candidatus Poribacteria bacterium]
MTKKETVINAIQLKDTPHVPYHMDFTPPVRRMLQEHYGADDVDRAVGSYILWLSWHPSLDFRGKRLGEHLIQDEYGVVWNDLPENRGYVERHPLDNPDLSGYEFPDPYAPGRFDGLKERIAAHQDIFLLAWVGDFFERAHFLRGLSELLADLHLNPQFVHDLLDNILEFLFGNLSQLAELGVDGIFLSDDYGHQHSLLMSPDHWREFIKPRLRELFARIRGAGLFTFLHSCGNVSEVIPDLTEIGLDVLHPIQPEAVDIASLKAKYGDKLAFYGGVSTQKTLPRGTPEEVEAEVRKTVNLMSRGGGYILAPGITLQHDIPLENILAFIDATQA